MGVVFIGLTPPTLQEARLKAAGVRKAPLNRTPPSPRNAVSMVTTPPQEEDGFLQESDPTVNSQVVTLATPDSQEALAASSSVQHDHTYSTQATPPGCTLSVADSRGTEELLSQELCSAEQMEVASAETDPVSAQTDQETPPLDTADATTIKTVSDTTDTNTADTTDLNTRMSAMQPESQVMDVDGGDTLTNKQPALETPPTLKESASSGMISNATPPTTPPPGADHVYSGGGGDPSVGASSVGDPSMGDTSVGDPLVGNSSVGDPSVRGSLVGDPLVEELVELMRGYSVMVSQSDTVTGQQLLRLSREAINFLASVNAKHATLDSTPNPTPLIRTTPPQKML